MKMLTKRRTFAANAQFAWRASSTRSRRGSVTGFGADVPNARGAGSFASAESRHRPFRVLTPRRMQFADRGGWPSVLGLLTAQTELPGELLAGAFEEVLSGNATPAQIAGLAIGLRCKGETVAEIETILGVLLAHGSTVPLPDAVRAAAVDCCGTGGDRSHSVNISTMAAFVLAGGGVTVCKHGNRAASSQAGSADVLEALGVNLELSPAGVAKCVVEAGLGFCLAPKFHPALRYAAPVRRELGVATIFNFLGPLANPGGVTRQAIGVPDAAMAPKMAGVLADRGSRALVFRGDDGLDELSTTTSSHVWDVADGRVTPWTLDPATLGLATASTEDLRGGTPLENAEAVRRLLGGEVGPVRDIVCLNAAAGFIVAGRCDDFASGLALARTSLECGHAAAALDRLVATSHQA